MGLFMIIIWWVLTTLMAVLGLAVSRLIFNHLPDHGWGLGRLMGLMLVMWAVWFGGSLGFPFGWFLLFLGVVGSAGLGGWLLWSDIDAVAAEWERNKRLMIFYEGLFIASILIFGLIRAYNPDIAGTEKPADFAFMTAVMKENSLPPEDPWFEGEAINYFYFGHFIFGALSLLSGASTGVGYNLGLIFLFGFVAQGAAAVGYLLSRKMLGAILATTMVLLMGNLFVFYQAWTNIFTIPALAEHTGKPIDGWSATDLWWHPSRVVMKTVPNNPNIALPGTEGGPPAPPAVLGGLHRHLIEKFQLQGLRTVDETINEFPLWSFVLGDLHAHVMGLLLIILNMGVLYGLVAIPRAGLRPYEERFKLPLLVAVVGITTGSVAMLNFWDLPMTIILLVLAILFSQLHHKRAEMQDKLMGLGVIGGGILVMHYLSVLPFRLNFIPQTKEDPLALIPAEKLTSLPNFFYMFGFFLILTVIYFAVEMFMKLQYESLPLWLPPILPPIFGVIAGVVHFQFAKGVTEHVTVRNIEPAGFISAVLAVCVTLVLYALYLAFRPPFADRRTMFVLGMNALAWAMIGGCEVVAIRDFYGGHLLRMNTLFKFYYQAWVLLGVSCSYFAVRGLTDHFKPFVGMKLKPAFIAVFSIFMFISLGYTVTGPMSKTNWLRAAGHIPTLDGLAYMRAFHREDGGAIDWLNANVTGRPTVLEAPGKAFSHYSRVSAATGLPTLLGWNNHQALWRDNTWGSIMEREGIAKEAFNTMDPNRFREIARQFDIQFVYVGPLERGDFPAENLAKFDQWTDMFELVNEQFGGKLYRVTLPMDAAS